MASKKPLVSIGMPVYNGERFISQALDSLLSQDFENFELIISDNASTDRTQQICLDYAQRDDRIRYYRNECNRGAVWNFNRVFELSSGEYFMWAAHDDYCEPSYLSSCLDVLSSSDTVVLAGAMCRIVDRETDKLRFVDQGFSTVGLSPRKRFMKYKTTIHAGKHIGAIFYGLCKRSVMAGIKPMRKVVGFDHLILAELCFEGEFVTIPEKLMVKRWGGASLSHKKNASATGVDNPILVNFPYFVREIMLQKIIFKTDKLRLSEKIRLSLWSVKHYFSTCVVHFLRRRFQASLAKDKAISRLLLDILRTRRAYARTNARIKKYIKSGRKPWTPGYKEYKNKILCDVLANKELLECFLRNRALPDKYGFRIDERVVEYPWVLARLDVAEGLLLDAGSALNREYTLAHPALRNKSFVIYNLSPEKVVRRSNISYIYGDLRHTILRDESFDEIVCISTLEHVGMNNTLLYSNDARFNEFKPDGYLDVVREFKRLLKPGGKLLITVPYGRYEYLGWLQQFDFKMVKAIVDIFGESPDNVAYYKYFTDGWQIADADACADCSYFNIHNRPDYEPDYVAAARAVACIETLK